MRRIVRQNVRVAGDYQEDDHWDVPQPVGNAVIQGEMQYPPQIDAPNYNAAHHHPPPPPVSAS